MPSSNDEEEDQEVTQMEVDELTKANKEHENNNDDDDDDDDDNDIDANEDGEGDDNNKKVDEESDENNENEEEEENEDEGEGHVIGGKIDKPAFALIAGIFADTTKQQELPVNIPITKIPAILGRTHDSSDPHFFGMGMRKALSRSQARIVYKDKYGGTIAQQGKDGVFKHEGPPPPSKTTNKPKLIRPQGSTVPEVFFAIECLGKNRIFVDRQRVEQGEMALLNHRSTIRMNQYFLYFLLPKKPPSYQPKTLTISLPSATPASNTKKRKISGSGGGGNDAKKAKPEEVVSSDTTTGGGMKDAKRKNYTGGFAAMAAELESAPVDDLIKEMSDAVTLHQWERRQQMIGTTVLLHAVRDTARSRRMRRRSDAQNGLSRAEIMKWIENSPRYKDWLSMLLTKMEFKSYQSNVSKALLKADFVRTGTTGRHVRWVLPDFPEEDLFDDDEEESERDEAPVASAEPETTAAPGSGIENSDGGANNANANENEQGEKGNNEENKDDNDDDDEEGQDNDDDDSSKSLDEDQEADNADGVTEEK